MTPKESADELAARRATFPTGPGVYLLKDRSGRVIYVGKAKSLRGRVQSYLRGGDGRMQVPFLVRHVSDVECLVTVNEKEALILENNLIKQYKPRYNIRLKDDKSYVSVKITEGEAWPRVLVTRKIVKDGSRYFGPFHSASSVRETLDVIRKVFPLRTCSDAVFRNRTRPCLDYQEHLRAVTLLLEGKDRQLERLLEQRMQAASEALRFEDAARLRDQIAALRRTSEHQKAVAHGGMDQDVFGLYREGVFIEVQVLMVRRGKLVANQAFEFAHWDFADEEVLGSVLTQFYQGERAVPDRILLPLAIEDAPARAELLRERRGRQVEILVPARGQGRQLVEMARANARQAFVERRDESERLAHSTEELRRRLDLRSAPKRIEAVDISTFQGGATVGSVVALDEGRPDKARYRRYRVRGAAAGDDFASMRQVLERRLVAGREAGDLPDLLVIDGGRGQLGVALAVRDEVGVPELDIVGLAKMRVERDARSAEVRRSEERVFLPGRVNPVVLPRNSNALFLLQRARDEAHRFAITYHQKLRDTSRLRSPLDDVAGVGRSRRRALLRHFGSLARIRAATPEELAAVPGIGRGLAERVARELLVEASASPGEVSPARPDGSSSESAADGEHPDEPSLQARLGRAHPDDCPL
jgi:excinuclease ABC subunit C